MFTRVTPNAFAKRVAHFMREQKGQTTLLLVDLSALKKSFMLRLKKDKIVGKLSERLYNMGGEVYLIGGDALGILPPQRASDTNRCVMAVRTLLAKTLGMVPPELRENKKIESLVQILELPDQRGALSQFLKKISTPFNTNALVLDADLTSLDDVSMDRVVATLTPFSPKDIAQEFLRKQHMARVTERSRGIQPVAYEVFISIADLQGCLYPSLTGSLAGHPAFHELGEICDRATLSHMARDDTQENIFINLSVEMFVSDLFAEFAKKRRKKNPNNEMWVDLDTREIRKRPKEIMAAHHRLVEYNVFIVVDGVTPDFCRDLKTLDFRFDAYKISALNDDDFSQGRQIVDFLWTHSPKKEIIVTQVESRAALSAAISYGLRYFQGHAIDSDLSEQRAFIQSSDKTSATIQSISAS